MANSTSDNDAIDKVREEFWKSGTPAKIAELQVEFVSTGGYPVDSLESLLGDPMFCFDFSAEENKLIDDILTNYSAKP